MLDSAEMGKMFIDSDVINTRMNLDRKIVGGIHWDSVRSYESMLKIIEMLRRTKGTLFFAHDAEWFQGVRKGAEYYT